MNHLRQQPPVPFGSSPTATRSAQPAFRPAPHRTHEQSAVAMADQVAREVGPSPTAAPVGDLAATGASPLPGSTRGFMEKAFGADFSQVRIHHGAQAAEMNRNLRARAFTRGDDIYFNHGQYQPGSRDGQQLLAHELTHVTQRQDRVQCAPEEETEAVKLGKLKTSVATQFGLKAVEDGDQAWTLADLTLARQALALIPATDVPALKGVVLKRVTALGGRTAGKFTSSQGVTGTTVTNDFMIELADLTFAGTDDGEKKRTVIHEVGHAIASHKERTATADSSAARAKANQKVDEANAAGVPFSQANDDMNAVVDAQTAKKAEFDAATPADKPALKKEFDALSRDYAAAKTKRDALEKAHDAKLAEQTAAESTATQKEQAIGATKISAADLAGVKTGADAAKTAHDTALAAAQKGATAAMKTGAEATAYFTALEETSKAVDVFFTETQNQDKDEDAVDGLVATVKTSLGTRDSAAAALLAKDPKNTLQPFCAGLEKAQNDFFYAAKAHALAHERTLRVQAFVKFVELKQIAPITPYAEKNWPHKPEEFYAEAYSFWVSKKLAAVSADLDKWFTDGKYKP